MLLGSTSLRSKAHLEYSLSFALRLSALCRLVLPGYQLTPVNGSVSVASDPSESVDNGAASNHPTVPKTLATRTAFQWVP
jgi:hypothetical protein